MELELTHVFDAPADRLWALLLDPQEMAGCVPGMKSVEVISDTEYRARIQIKIAFISAKFDVRTVITEMTPPGFLRCETSGEDSAVGSSVKSVNEMTLTALEDGRTELRVTSKATVLGRLGSLGLNPMKTKAERLWEQFCGNVEARLTASEAPETVAVPEIVATESAAEFAAETTISEPVAEPAAPAPASVNTPATAPLPPQAAAQRRPAGAVLGLRRLFGGGGDTIRVELRRNGTDVVLHWPASRAGECLAWLDRQLETDGGA